MKLPPVRRRTPGCEAFFGRRGEGKTVTVLTRWISGPLLGVDMSPCATVTYDIKGSLVRSQLAHGVAKGKGHLFIHDIVRKADTMPRWEWFEAPSAADPFERQL